MSEVSISQF
jgi:hypothetical protein